MGCLATAISIYHPVSLQLSAIPKHGGKWPFVTSNTPNKGENNFVDVESGLSTDLTMLNCTLYERFNIGVVKEDSTGSESGFEVLE